MSLHPSDPSGRPAEHPAGTLVPTGAEALRGLCGGRVHLPPDVAAAGSDPTAYDAARVPWNLTVDQRPAAVALPRTADEVAEVVRAAAAAGLRVAPQSTGHNAAPLAAGGLGDVALLRLSELTGVTVDPEARTARVLGGTLWGDVAAAAAVHGLAAMHGSAPDVAAVGYLLGGGLSFYGRRHGLAAHQLLAVEVVLADGSLVRADAAHHAELFWALRGGGGNLGVVTAMEIALLPYAEVYAGMLLWDRERAPEVVPAWAAWTRELPDSVTSTMRVMSFPPLPELPPFLSGRQLVVIDGAVLEDDDRAAELLAPLRALAPDMDTFERIPAPALTMVHMDPPGPSPAVSGHTMLTSFDADAAAALLGEVGPGSRTSLLAAEVRHLGGALQSPPPDAGVLSHLPEEYALFCVAIAPVPEAAAAGLADADRVLAAMGPWDSGRSFLNFTERPVEAATAYDAAALARLRRVRAEVDPTGVFVANHRV